jgi:hypothetical protein
MWPFKKKIQPAAIINEKAVTQQLKDVCVNWSSSLTKESCIKINNDDWVIIDIGYQFVVVRDKEYNTWQIERRLLENAS